MADNHLDRILNHQSTELNAYEYDRLVNVVNAQLFGLSSIFAAGIYEHGWAVSAGSGLNAIVAAGSGIIDGDNGFVFAETTTATTVGVAAGMVDDTDVNYLYVELVEEVGYWDLDTRDDAAPTFVVYDSDGDRTGALILAQVKTAAGVITEVVDLRVDIMVSDHDDRLDVLDAWVTATEGYIGADYFDGSPPASIDARIDALEAGGGGGGGPAYWGVLEEALGDTTTIRQAIEASSADTLAAALAGQAATFESENWDEDAVNTLETIARMVHFVGPEICASALGVNDRYRTVVLIPGIVGHLALGDPNGIIDEVNSSMEIVDFVNHRFG